jgi:hypothetical protein
MLGAGDVVLLPRNDLHLVGSDLSLPPVAGSDIIQPPKNGGLSSIHHGGGGRHTPVKFDHKSLVARPSTRGCACERKFG